MQTHRPVMARGLASVHIDTKAAPKTVIKTAPKTASHRREEIDSKVVVAACLVLSALLTLTLVGIGVLVALR